MRTESLHLGMETLIAEAGGEAGEGVQEHLASCAACRAEAESWRAVGGGVRHLVAAAPVPPALPGGVLTGAGQGRTRRRVLVAVAAAGVLAAGAVSYGLAGGAGGSGYPAAAPAAGGHTDAVTVAYVTSHVEAALTQVSGYILQSRQSFHGGGTVTTWTDPVTLASRQVVGSGGRAGGETWSRVSDVAGTLHWRNTVVDFGDRTWFADEVRAPGPAPARPRTTPGDAVPGGSPAQLRREIGTGTVTIAGHGVVNGHHAVELRIGSRDGAVSRLWVDARSYQAVRLVVSAGARILVINESWIPKTPALVRQTSTPQIPAGFARVTPPSLSS